jgi:hypothetical protein
MKVTNRIKVEDVWRISRRKARLARMQAEVTDRLTAREERSEAPLASSRAEMQLHALFAAQALQDAAQERREKLLTNIMDVLDGKEKTNELLV